MADEATTRGDAAKMFSLLPIQLGPERGADARRSEGERGPRRDYSSALDLIREAQEALRLAEERNEELEAQIQDMAHQYREELARVQAQIAQLEQRSKAAERRAEDAEGWLERLHEGIVTAFRPRT